MASNGQNHFFLTLLLIVTMWTSGTVHSQMFPESSLLEKYEKWMDKYGKVYKDIQEKEKRFNIFKLNVEYIEGFNSAGTKPYKLGINQFADLTNEEFSSRNRFKGHMCSSITRTSSFKYENVTDVPSSVDWRQQGAVTPIKNQGQCGKSCSIAPKN